MPSPLLPIKLVCTSVGHAEQANKLAAGLIQARLAACVQILPQGQSVYRWQGKVAKEAEYFMHIKTDALHVEAVVSWLKAAHPYELPEIVVVDAMADADYGQWLQQQLQK